MNVGEEIQDIYCRLLKLGWKVEGTTWINDRYHIDLYHPTKRKGRAPHMRKRRITKILYPRALIE